MQPDAMGDAAGCHGDSRWGCALGMLGSKNCRRGLVLFQPHTLNEHSWVEEAHKRSGTLSGSYITVHHHTMASSYSTTSPMYDRRGGGQVVNVAFEDAIFGNTGVSTETRHFG